MKAIAIALPALLLFLILSPTTASANATGFDHGLGVFASLTSTDKVTTLAAGESAYLVVVTDGFDAYGPQGLQTAQFGVEVDPRLEVVSRYVTPEAFFIFNPEPDEWQLGIQRCLGSGEHPYALVTYEVRLAAGVTDIADLRVGVRPLTSIGEPILYGGCTAPEYLQRFHDAGGVLLNPTEPSIVHFSSEPDVLVEGRPLTLAWETYGADQVTLDGQPVATTGSQTAAPSADTVFELQSTRGAETRTATRRVEVIREPRVEYFQARLFDTGDEIRVQLSWDVRGTSNVSVDGAAGTTYPRDVALVPYTGTNVWHLTSTNEWGTTAATATLGDAEDQPPAIIRFVANPVLFTQGTPVSLEYAVYNATLVTIEPGVGPVNPTAGSITLTPTETTTYTLTASNVNGTVTSETFAQLKPPVIYSFLAEPEEVYGGFSTTLRWSVDPGLDLEITPDVGPVTGEMGSVEVTPFQFETNYTLTATNAEGTATAHARTQWLPPEVDFSASSLEPFANEPLTLWASVSGALSVTLDPGFGTIDPTGGEFVTLVEAPTTFVLTAVNLFDTVSQSVTVTPRRPVVELTASKLNPYPGEEVVLTATIEGADTATLEPGFGTIDPTDGTFVVSVTTSTTFVLSASNAAGTSTAAVTLAPGAPTVELTADRTEVDLGDAVELTATILGATDATLEPGFGSIDPGGGSFTAAVESTTTFTLTASNAEATAVDQVTVTLRPPVVSLEASATTPYPGVEIHLAATVHGATTATLEPGFGSIDPGGGVFPVVVTEPTTFVLTATNPSATVTDQVSVTPRPPSAQLTASQPAVFAGEDVELTATIQGADTATLEPGVGSIDPSGGDFVTTVLATTTFTLSATNLAGTTTDQVTVQARPPEIRFFRTDRSQILTGDTATLSWDVAGATLITIEPLGFTTTDATGTLVVDPAETTVYTLTASNGAGETAAQVGIDVLPFVILSFTADPQQIEAGESVILAWEVVGVAGVSIDDIGPVPMVGTMVVQPQTTTTYRLRATNGPVTMTRSVVVAVGIPGSGSLYFSWSDTQYPGPDPQLQAGVPFDVYVLAIDPTHGLAGFEFSLDIPPCVIALASVLSSPGGINVGAAPYNWIVGTGECLQGVIVPLLRITFIAFDDFCFFTSTLYLGAATPSSFVPPAAGFLTCTEELVPFEVGPGLSLDHLGPPAVAVLMDFTARGEPEGVRLQWDLTAAGSAGESLTLLRRPAASSLGSPGSQRTSYRTIARLTGAQVTPVGSWLDETARPGVDYAYLLRADLDGLVVDSEEVRATRPGSTTATRSRLLANRPNPFNPATELRFYLAEPADATLHVLDVSGRHVRTLNRRGLSAGEHFVTWDGRDAHGASVASGIYVVRLQAGDAVDTRRITLLR